MSLPKKITPNPIADSFFEIKYISDLPYELIIGILYTKLKDNYQYLPSSLSETNRSNNSISIERVNPTFFNENVKFEVRKESILFNCKESYIGWERYFEEIKKVMDFVNSLGIVKRYSKIGVRYVNIFNDDNILDNVYLKTNILGKNGEYDSRTIRAEFSSDDYKVIVQLNHKVKLKSTEKFVSLFDIDVIKMIDTEITFDKLLEEINVIRQKEKEVFFKIVKEDFIEKKFNPEF